MGLEAEERAGLNIWGAGWGWGNNLRGAESRNVWGCWEHVGDPMSQFSLSFLVQGFASWGGDEAWSGGS